MSRIPISAAKELSKKYDLDQVYLIAWDRGRNLVHTVTYGKSVEDCDQVAQGMDNLRKFLKLGNGMPVYPSRVKALRQQVMELQARIAELEGASE